MNTPVNHTGKPASHHPMMIAAAIAIILFCLAGTAAIMGWIPSTIGNNNSSGDLTASDRAALASSLADSSGNSFNSSAAGLEAQRERERLAQLDRDANVQRDAERERAAEREREAERSALAQRERAPALRDEPVRLAQAAPARERNVCSNCGKVTSVRAIKTRAEGSGVGAAGGAILGGLLGNQVGGGNGRKLATVAGAVGGAVVGNQVEGNMKATTSYEVKVRMDGGATRTFNLQNLNGYSTGDRIKVVNGGLRHAG